MTQRDGSNRNYEEMQGWIVRRFGRRLDGNELLQLYALALRAMADNADRAREAEYFDVE